MKKVSHAIAVSVLLAACSGKESAKSTAAEAPASPPVATAATTSMSQVDWSKKTFEEFKATVKKEGDRYIVSGDIAISDEKELKAFFRQLQRRYHEEDQGRLVKFGSKGLWSSAQRKNLTYCVSPEFGDRHEKVVAAMSDAAGAWEKAANINLRYVQEEDANCTNHNDNVVFDVAPTTSTESYYAIAFFPYQPRRDRTVVIYDLSFKTPAGALPELAGVLRHELGHVLGFRHEFVHPGSGKCLSEDFPKDVKAVTPYDAFSVMNYPDCNEQLGYQFKLTEKDKSGAACQYGEAADFKINKDLLSDRSCLTPVKPPANLPAPTIKTFKGESVSAGGRNLYGPFVAIPGTTIRITMTSPGNDTGDADLYVRLANEPTEEEDKNDCRSILSGSEEICELDALTAPRNKVRLLVTGVSPARYELTVTYLKAP